MLNQKGVSLVQILVSIGLLGAISVMFMKQTEIGVKSARVTQQKFEQTGLENLIRNHLSDARVCTHNFQSINFPSLLTPPAPAAEPSQNFLGPITSYNPPEPERNKFVVGELYQSGLLKILRFDIVGYRPIRGEFGTSILRVTLERTGAQSNSLGVKEQITDVNLIVRSDGAGTLISCSSADINNSHWQANSNGINYPRGNVGIGPITPTAPLHIANIPGDPQVLISAGAKSNIVFQSNATSAEISYEDTSRQFRLTNSGSSPVAIRQGGTVSIGFDNPPDAGLNNPALVVQSSLGGGIEIKGLSQAPAGMGRLIVEDYGMRWAVAARNGFMKVGNSSGAGGPNLHLHSDGRAVFHTNGNTLFAPTQDIDSAWPAGDGVSRYRFHGDVTVDASKRLYLHRMDLNPVAAASVSRIKSERSLDVKGELRVLNGPDHTSKISVEDGGEVHIRNGGKLRVKDIEPLAGAVQINGNLQASGEIRISSDERLKTDIDFLDSSLDKLLQIKGVSYFWSPEFRKSNKRQIGVLAQDVEKVFPELVKADEEGIKSVNYQALMAPMIEAMRELKNQIEEQNKKIKELEDKLNQK